MAEIEAAVAIVRARATESVLLILRAERADDPWSGHWSFPGGRRDPEDSDLLHTALRELEEECGIRLTRHQLEAQLSPSLARRRVGPFVRVAPFVFHVDDEQPTQLDAREVAGAQWVPLRMLSDPAQHALQSVPGLPPEVRFPAIDLGGVKLWGFTYRLITDWLGLNPKEPLEEAGFQAAHELLDHLIANGCALVEGWVERDGARIATVQGAIPAERVWAQVASAAPHFPRVNMLEVQPGHIRLVGLVFEEYIIRTTG